MYIKLKKKKNHFLFYQVPLFQKLHRTWKLNMLYIIIGRTFSTKYYDKIQIGGEMDIFWLFLSRYFSFFLLFKALSRFFFV